MAGPRSTNRTSQTPLSYNYRPSRRWSRHRTGRLPLGLAPIVGMPLTPPAHPLGVTRATEGILVLLFGQPNQLAASFATLPTSVLPAEFLVMTITGIGNENLPAALAFQRDARKSSTRPRPPDQLVPIQFTPTLARRFTEKNEENVSPKRSKKTADKNTAFSN